jgi:hypothetical protein
MTPIRMLASALAVLALAAPVASAAVAAPDRQVPPVLQRQDLRSPDARDAAVWQRQDLRPPDAALRSPGHPSGHPGVPAADRVVVDDNGGSSIDWTPIVLAAGLGVGAFCLVALLVSRRRPGAVA